MSVKLLPSNNLILLAASLGGAILIGVAFFWIGWASRPVPDTSRIEALANRYRSLGRRVRGFPADAVRQAVKADEIRQHLVRLTWQPHIAGTDEYAAATSYFHEVLARLVGFTVLTRSYSVTVSLPEKPGESQFVIVYANGSQEASQKQEAVLAPQNLTGQVAPILAFTPSGDVSGPVVFANYGKEADFQELRKRNVTLNGTIALIRYGGGLGRGKKLVNAAAYGCIGGIVYSDPADGWAKQAGGPTYPDSWWLPPTGVQRGSAKLRQADPQTPGYPSLPFVFRESFDELNRLNDPPVFSPIPGYPVGYGDAMKLLRVLGGENISDLVRGGLPISYRTGGSFVPEVNHTRLTVKNRMKNVTAINIFAEMTGDLEPDRYVLMGNHRDAWSAGAVDASSGTSVLLEIARVLSGFYVNGWRPRRTILLCSWDVEEQGITGSWEWVEDRLPQIRDRVVAYINIDIAVRGNYTIRPNADPMLQEAALQALRNMPAEDGGGNMFDDFDKRWLKRNHTLSVPISSSDYAGFVQTAGVPVIDATYVSDPSYNSYYPVYHSMYETFSVMERIIHPGLKAHREVAIWGVEILRLLSESWLLPYNEVALVRYLRGRYRSSRDPSKWGWPPSAINYTNYATSAWLGEFDSALTALEAESARLADACRRLQTRIDSGDEDIDPMEVRSLNDRRMRTLQTLTSSAGQPRDRTLQSVVFSARTEETKVSAGFPGLTDLVAVARKKKDQPDELARWKQVAQHLSTIILRMHSLRYQMQVSGL